MPGSTIIFLVRWEQEGRLRERKFNKKKDAKKFYEKKKRYGVPAQLCWAAPPSFFWRLWNARLSWIGQSFRLRNIAIGFLSAAALISALVLMSGCSNATVVGIHMTSKALAPSGGLACYDVNEPEEIKGRYCLKYIGPGEEESQVKETRI